MQWAERVPDPRRVQADPRDIEAAIAALKTALLALYEWYDRDGSVGGASDVFENNRAALAPRKD